MMARCAGAAHPITDTPASTRMQLDKARTANVRHLQWSAVVTGESAGCFDLEQQFAAANIATQKDQAWIVSQVPA